jgi:leucyl-tRNA synthetase
MPVDVLLKCANSFAYWYNNTSRHSGLDLVANHLTMYIFNHVGILPQKLWPKQIVVNALVNYEGQKMSKSMGNIIPLAEGIEKYGSDPLRFIEVTGADLDTETEFSPDAINGTKARNEYLADVVRKLDELESRELHHIDYWLYSVLNSKIRDATAALDKLEIKSAYTKIYYESISQLKHYRDRGGSNHLVVAEFMQDLALMLAPAMPHFAEELWEMLDNSGLVAAERWPSPDLSMISAEAEKAERILEDTIMDIAHAVELTSKMPQNSGKKPSEIMIAIADDWKSAALEKLASSQSMQDAIESVSAVDKESAAKFLAPFAKKMKELKLGVAIPSSVLLSIMAEAADYIGSRFGAKVVVETESASKSQRASRAIPGKPSIDITWS